MHGLAFQAQAIHFLRTVATENIWVYSNQNNYVILWVYVVNGGGAASTKLRLVDIVESCQPELVATLI